MWSLTHILSGTDRGNNYKVIMAFTSRSLTQPWIGREVGCCIRWGDPSNLRRMISHLQTSQDATISIDLLCGLANCNGRIAGEHLSWSCYELWSWNPECDSDWNVSRWSSSKPSYTLLESSFDIRRKAFRVCTIIKIIELQEPVSYLTLSLTGCLRCQSSHFCLFFRNWYPQRYAREGEKWRYFDQGAQRKSNWERRSCGKQPSSESYCTVFNVPVDDFWKTSTYQDLNRSENLYLWSFRLRTPMFHGREGISFVQLSKTPK